MTKQDKERTLVLVLIGLIILVGVSFAYFVLAMRTPTTDTDTEVTRKNYMMLGPEGRHSGMAEYFQRIPDPDNNVVCYIAADPGKAIAIHCVHLGAK